jgi:hypothetical protein
MRGLFLPGGVKISRGEVANMATDNWLPAKRSSEPLKMKSEKIQ